MNIPASFLGTRRGRRLTTAVALLTTGALASTLMGIGPASAVDGPKGHQQFVQIVAKDNGGWFADMNLYDKNGNKVYTWHKEPKAMSSKATWWYTMGDGYIDGTITLVLGEGDLSRHHFHYTPADAAGHCWRITYLAVTDAGDSATGGCTPD